MRRSERQIAASRANGAKSRGPVTPEGKRKSSRNATQHGLLADTLVLDGESTEQFMALLDALTEELQPRPGVERTFVDCMAAARWRQMRAWALEKSGLDREIRRRQITAPAEDAPTRAALAFRALSDNSASLALLNRYEARFDRQYASALREFNEVRERRCASREENTLEKYDIAIRTHK